MIGDKKISSDNLDNRLKFWERTTFIYSLLKKHLPNENNYEDILRDICPSFGVKSLVKDIKTHAKEFTSYDLTDEEIMVSWIVYLEKALAKKIETEKNSI